MCAAKAVAIVRLCEKTILLQESNKVGSLHHLQPFIHCLQFDAFARMRPTARIREVDGSPISSMRVPDLKLDGEKTCRGN